MDAGEEHERGRVIGKDAEAMYCTKKVQVTITHLNASLDIPCLLGDVLSKLHIRTEELRIVTISIKSSDMSYS